jgi:hypothetical protein
MNKFMDDMARFIDDHPDVSPRDKLEALVINTAAVGKSNYRGVEDFLSDYSALMDRMMDFLTDHGHPVFKISFLSTLFLNAAMNATKFPYHIFTKEFVEHMKENVGKIGESVDKAIKAKMN